MTGDLVTIARQSWSNGFFPLFSAAHPKTLSCKNEISINNNNNKKLCNMFAGFVYTNLFKKKWFCVYSCVLLLFWLPLPLLLLLLLLQLFKWCWLSMRQQQSFYSPNTLHIYYFRLELLGIRLWKEEKKEKRTVVVCAAAFVYDAVPSFLLVPYYSFARTFFMKIFAMMNEEEQYL